MLTHLLAPCSAFLMAVLLPCGVSLASPPDFEISLYESNGLPSISKGGAVAVRSAFALFGKDWEWSPMKTSLEVLDPGRYAVRGRRASLDLDLASSIEATEGTEVRWDFDLRTGSPLQDIVGGGLSFVFDLDTFQPEMGEPRLLPLKRGWAWGEKGAAYLEMAFDRPLEDIYFERGRKNEIRASFYKGDVPAGRKKISAILSAEGANFVGVASERFGIAREKPWLSVEMAPFGTPVDLSFLNEAERPAGKRGFVRAEGGQLVFADGTPARFWGTNLTAGALFRTDAENVRRHARRLSALGFNMVRIHHHDSKWVRPNVLGAPSRRSDQLLDPQSMDRLDWWIACLKEEGIYVWLDLHVGRQLVAEDGISGFDEISKGVGSADLKGYNYVNDTIVAAMQRFNEAYLGHVNRYTGVSYKDEPAIAVVMITNENDLTTHFGNLFLPLRKNPLHTAGYEELAREFFREQGLPSSGILRTWEAGAPNLFMSELEHRFNRKMISHLRTLGVKVPIVTTNYWGNSRLSSLPSLADGDLIDVHVYAGEDELRNDPAYAPTSADWVAAASLQNKPLAVSEWNLESTASVDRHVMPLYMAAAGSLQNWNVLLHFAYAKDPLNGGESWARWQMFNDPVGVATLPAAALLFRRQDVSSTCPAEVLDLTAEQVFEKSLSPKNLRLLRGRVDRQRVRVRLPEVGPLPWIDASVRAGAQAAAIAPAPSYGRSGTQSRGDCDAVPSLRDHRRGMLRVDSPRSKVAAGWFHGKPVDLGGVRLRLDQTHASMAVQSMDGEAIETSRDVLLTIAGLSRLDRSSSPRYAFQPARGAVEIDSEVLQDACFMSPASSACLPLPVGRSDGTVRVTLPGDKALWAVRLTGRK